MPGLIGLTALSADVTATMPLNTPAVSTATTGTLTAGATHRLDATSAPLARTLPSAVTAGAGGIVVVKKTDATSNAVTVTAIGSDTINVSGSTRTLTLPREAAHFRSDGVSDWTVVASDTPVAQLDSRYDARYVTPATGNGTYAQVIGLVGAGIDLTGATDSTAALNALLATAGGKVARGVPGATYLISAPLVVKSGGALDMTGCTVTLASGSNCNMLQNAAVATAAASASDGATTSGSAVITTSLGAQALAGQTVVVVGAGANGNGPLVGLIASATSTTITITDLRGVAVNASATVSSASVKLYNRDSNITVKGGTWVRGSNAGSGSALHSLVFRHVDGLNVDIDNITSSAGKYALSVGDATRVEARFRNGNTASDGIHITGPADRVTIGKTEMTTGDDMVAFTCNDYAAYNDTCGDISNVHVGTLLPVASKEALKFLAGAGTTLHNATATFTGGSVTTNAVFVGDDTGSANTTGGTYGTLDLGQISSRVTNASAFPLTLLSPTADRISASIRDTVPRTGVPLSCSVGGASTATIGVLELRSCDFSATSTGTPNFVSVNSANVTVDELNIDRARIYGVSLTHNLVYVHAGTVNAIILRDCVHKGTTTNGNDVLQDGGTIGSVRVRGGYLSTVANVHRSTGGTPPTAVTLDSVTISAASRTVQTSAAGSTIVVELINPTLLNAVAQAQLFANGCNLTVKGQATLSSVSTLIGRSAGTETIRVLGPTIPCDGAIVTGTAGDMFYNTNTSWSSGTGTDKSGLYGYTGSAWTKVFGPA